MKLTAILLTIATLQVFAGSVYSQDKELTLNLGETNVGQVLTEIENQSEFSFLFNQKLVDTEREVNINMSGKKIEEVLNHVFSETNTDYIVLNRQIVLSPKEYLLKVKAAIQPGTVTGRVTGPEGEPLIGATVNIKGSSTGTITGVEGRYSLSEVPENATLVFSYVGMLSQEIIVGNRTTIDVTLEVDALGLEEIVVVGYGTQRKSDLTGAVASINGGDLNESAAVSIAETLAGRAAGIQVQEINGRPGGGDIMIRVRGAGSITAGNDPLYVIDGFPMEEPGLNMLNPNDIESIEVLKDASASAIYGSRGGNGVVLITTKRGNETEGSNIEFNMNAGIQQVAHRPEMMDTYEYAEWFIDGHNNAWIQADPENNTINDPNDVRIESYYIIPDEMYTPEVLPNTDWGDEIFRNAPTQSYSLSASNNSEKGHFAIGGSYVNQEGIVLATGYEKFNLRSNLVTKLTDRITVGLNLDGSYSTSDLIEEGKYGPVELSLVVAPVYPVYNPDGTYGSPVSSTWFKGDDPSPLEGALEIDWTEKMYRTFGKIFADIEITKGLRYNISLGGIVSGRQEDRYRPSYIGRDSNPPPNQADAYQNTSSSFNWLLENTMTYDALIGDNHQITALAGFTSQKNRNDLSYMYATNFPNDAIHTLSAGQVTDGYTRYTEHSLVSYLARVNYNFANKYLVTATVRADGSSRFGANNKWGTFPSASVGWRVSEEDFMQNIESISSLKIRLSHGYTGNYNIPNYGAIGLLTNGYAVFGPGTGSLVGAVYPSTIPNPDLGWEKTQMTDIGMDVGLLKNRVYFEFDYYNSITKDLLLDVPVPTITGFGSQLQNIGKVRNKGVEFMITTRNLVGNFRWTTDFNISRNVNEVLALGPEDKPIYASAPNARNSFITEVGSPISNLFGYIFDGVYLTEEQINSQPHLSTDVPGDPIIRDVNGDGEISSDDRAVIGNNQPDFIFGLNNTFNYKNFDLNVLITGSYGAEVLRLSSRFTDFYHGDRNGTAEAVDRWRSPSQPGGGEYFRANRLYEGLQKQPSTYWVEDGSFVRIKNITLGYNFSSSMLQKIKVRSARIYGSITNLYTFTNYWGFDPEASTTGTGLSKGGDYSSYPLARTFLLGVNFSF